MKNFHSLSKVERRAFPGAQSTYTDIPTVPRSEVIWLTSTDSHGDWITGLFAAGDPERKECLIHFYAGNENLAKMGSFIETCRSRGLSVLMFDYRGYGASRGRPRESAFYSDAELIYDWLRERYPDYRAIISGRALGTAVAIYLAQHREAKGLVLLSPFTSMMEIVSDIFPKDEIVIEEAMPFIFDNLERIRKVNVPDFDGGRLRGRHRTALHDRGTRSRGENLTHTPGRGRCRTHGSSGARRRDRVAGRL